VTLPKCSKFNLTLDDCKVKINVNKIPKVENITTIRTGTGAPAKIFN
jgi:hypothetical protein